MNYTIELVEKPRHLYLVNGAERDSISDVIRFISREKQDKAPILKRDAAADRGRRVHEYCQLYDYGALPDQIDVDCVGYVEAYMAFLRDFRIKEWLFTELMLGCPDCAGTIDRIGMIGGIRTIVDLKCTAALDKYAVSAQLGGYDYLHEHEFGYGAGQLWAVRLKNDGKYVRPYNAELPHEAFASCLWKHKYLKGELTA
jgi:hypothetical protein